MTKKELIEQLKDVSDDTEIKIQTIVKGKYQILCVTGNVIEIYKGETLMKYNG